MKIANSLFVSNIKRRLAFTFALVTSLILVTFSVVVIQYYSNFRESSYYNRLRENGYYLALNVLVQDKMLPDTTTGLSRVKDFMPMRGQKLTIFDAKNQPIETYKGGVSYKPDMLMKLRHSREQYYQVNDTQYVVFTMNLHKQNYLILTSSYDNVGFQKLIALRRLILILLFCSIIIVFLIGTWFAGILLMPIKDIISKANEIKGNNLHLRIPVKNKDDELGKLAMTFNNMLDRIENTFLIEKGFVANASHEYRTPLTAMKGQIQVALMRDRTNEEYVKLLDSLLEDINRLISLQMALSELVKAQSKFVNNNFKYLPFLEIVSEAKRNLLATHDNYIIDIVVHSYPENTDESVIFGDEALLISAINNLMDNACKYSDNHTCSVKIQFVKGYIQIAVEDDGAGILEEDLKYVFEPFYRAKNTITKRGFGVGLSIVNRIVEAHSGSIKIDSKVNVGTKVQIVLPSMLIKG